MARNKLRIAPYRRSDGKFDWRAKRGSEIVATSGGQGYENRADCEETLKNYLDDIRAGNYTVEEID